MNKKLVMGIDTSNYTTSVALVDDSGEVVANVKKLLPVKEGECGLRQSDAVFAHIKNLSFVMDEIEEYTKGAEIAAIGVSSRPRNVEGSYMPCFLCGVSVAKSISAVTGAPIYEFSHQCGHMMAALYSAEAMKIVEKQFLAFHVSGGTTEALSVSYADFGFDAKIVGGTKDLNAGQLVDRIGVMLGLRFPCGAELERIALLCEEKVPSKSANVCDGYFNLSGAENLLKQYSESNTASATAAYAFSYVGKTLLKTTQNLLEKYGDMPVVYAGGVMSNSIIKSILRKTPNTYFAEPRFSSDNAAGIALLAFNKINTKNI